MNRLQFIVWILLCAVTGVVLFRTSYKVEYLETHLARLNQKIITEQDSIRVLKAEWSYLNDPNRLERLVKTHLNLQPTKPVQLASLNDIPLHLAAETPQDENESRALRFVDLSPSSPILSTAPIDFSKRHPPLSSHPSLALIDYSYVTP